MLVFVLHVCACGRSMFCKHLETEVLYLCGARYNYLLQCRTPVTERGLFICYIIILFQFIKSISLGNKIQNVDIIKHNESQKQKWVMFHFLGMKHISQDYSRGPICIQPTEQNALYSNLFETKTFKHRKQISSQWFYQLTCLDGGNKYTGQIGEEF
jgi:hypothetical protein